jgi:hypothetical protein
VESDSSDEEGGKKPAALPRAENIAGIKDTCKVLTARGIGARNLRTNSQKTVSPNWQVISLVPAAFTTL